MNTTSRVLDKKDIASLNWRWIIYGQIAWSYNKMQAPGYFAATYPCLKKVYKDDPEGLKKSVKSSINFFNTTPYPAHLILGITVGMEEAEKSEILEAVDALKAGLMGPFAGVGDTIFGVILPTIFGAIAAYMALAGNPTGVIIWVVVNIAILLTRIKITQLGYESGSKIITTYSDKINKFTQSAMVLGLVVIGGLMSTIITINLNNTLSIGDVAIDLQAMSDQILPSLMPLLLTVLCYYLLGKKKMTSTKLIFIVIALGIVLSMTGILI